MGVKRCEKVWKPRPHRICSFFVFCGVLVLSHGSLTVYFCDKEGYEEVWDSTSTFGGSAFKGRGGH